MRYDYYILRPAVSPDCDGMWVVELWVDEPLVDAEEEVLTGHQVRFDTVMFDGLGAKDLAEQFAAGFDIPNR